MADGLFLLYMKPGDARDAAGPAIPGDARMLDDGLYVVRSALGRSRLYHHVKRQLPTGTPLLVAPLSSDPKFKGMRAGALKWLRETSG